MKCQFFLICFLSLVFSINAQHYPPEWIGYLSGEYIYDIQNTKKDRSISETDLKNKLLSTARTNLAKQIKMHVQDVALLNKTSIDGRSFVNYSSNTIFTTDVEMKLVETKTYYNTQTDDMFAIAYINKGGACRFYDNEYSQLVTSLENSLIISENYLKTGFKGKAKEELQSKIGMISNIEDVLSWLNMFGFSSEKLSLYQQKKNLLEQKLKESIAALKHSLVVCLECNASISGSSYNKLQNEIKGDISKTGCSFTSDKSEADYIITIEAYNDEDFVNEISGVKSYFTYVSASVTIEKNGQYIYEDELTVKGGHTRSSYDAAKSGYKEIKQRLSRVITENISEK